MRTALLLLVLLVAPARAQDKPPASGIASKELVVEGSGGGYDVTVSATYVTVFYLPERVTRALASDQQTFRINIMDDTVAVRPTKTAISGAKANLAIDTSSLK